jgi:heme/copper-type cytochrome/quinol oxidase subunit 3
MATNVERNLVESNIAIATRLWAGATVFFFLGPFFAYVYLRSLDSAGMWRPAGLDPPQGYGAAIVLLTVASAVALVLASRAWGSPRGRASLPLVAVALVLGLGAVALQIAEYAQLGFGPTDGGYASVFVAWTGLAALFTLVTMVWLETVLAYCLRSGRRTSIAADDLDSPAAFVGPRLAALGFYWAFLAGLSVVMWIVLYLF